MAADALAPSITRSSAAMTYIDYSKIGRLLLT